MCVVAGPPSRRSWKVRSVKLPSTVSSAGVTVSEAPLTGAKLVSPTIDQRSADGAANSGPAQVGRQAMPCKASVFSDRLTFR